MKVMRAKGEGQGSCRRCTERDTWNRTWMCFLWKIEGYDGVYCHTCTNEIIKENEQNEQNGTD